MSVRIVIEAGDLKLKAKNKTVSNVKSSQIKKVFKDLIDTMPKAGLIGVAA